MNTNPQTILENPALFLQQIKRARKGSVEAVSLLVTTCSDAKHWQTLRDGGIFKEICRACEHETTVTGMIKGLDSYTSCLKHLLKQKNVTSKAYKAAFRDAFDCIGLLRAIWSALLSFQYANERQAQMLMQPYRLAIENFLHALASIENRKWKRDEDDFDGDLEFMTLMFGFHQLHILVLHCWIFAEHDQHRKAVSFVLSQIEPMWVDDVCREDFALEHYQNNLRQYTKSVGKNQLMDQVQKVLQFSGDHSRGIADVLEFLVDLPMAKKMTFPPAMEVDLATAYWRVMEESKDERSASNFQTVERCFGALMRELLKASDTPIRILTNLINLPYAQMMMKETVIRAAWEVVAGEPIILVTDFLNHISPDEKNWSPEGKALVSTVRQHIQPIWFEVLNGVRAKLKSSFDFNSRSWVISQWKAFGTLMVIADETQLRVGCSWYKCKEFDKTTNQRMLACTNCQKSQYCDEKCQLSDWKEGRHKNICQKPT